MTILDGLIASSRHEAFDHGNIAIEPPEFGHPQRGVDTRPVDLGWRDVDLDGQIGTGETFGAVGANAARLVSSLHPGDPLSFPGVEEVPLVRLEAPLDTGLSPCGLAVRLDRNALGLRNRDVELID